VYTARGFGDYVSATYLQRSCNNEYTTCSKHCYSSHWNVAAGVLCVGFPRLPASVTLLPPTSFVLLLAMCSAITREHKNSNWESPVSASNWIHNFSNDHTCCLILYHKTNSFETETSTVLFRILPSFFRSVGTHLHGRYYIILNSTIPILFNNAWLSLWNTSKSNEIGSILSDWIVFRTGLRANKRRWNLRIGRCIRYPGSNHRRPTSCLPIEVVATVTDASPGLSAA